MRTMPTIASTRYFDHARDVLCPPTYGEKFSVSDLDHILGIIELFGGQDDVFVWETTGFDYRGREERRINLCGSLPASVLEPFKRACHEIGADVLSDVIECGRYPLELGGSFDRPIIRWHTPDGPQGRGDTFEPDPGQLPAFILAAKGEWGVEIPANFEDYCEDDPPPGDGGDLLDAQDDTPVRLESKAPIVLKEGARDEARRRQQQEENVRIQNEVINVLPPVMSVDDMLDDCVWIAEGSQVGRLSSPRRVLSFKEFSDLTASSVTEVGDREGNAKPRKVPNAILWMRSATRKTVQVRTFHAGAGAICLDPDGGAALNSWRPVERRKAVADVHAPAEDRAGRDARERRAEAPLEGGTGSLWPRPTLRPAGQCPTQPEQ